jgi:hypothetical protein
MDSRVILAGAIVFATLVGAWTGGLVDRGRATAVMIMIIY